MKKNYFLLLCYFFITFFSSAQQNADATALKKAKAMLAENSPFNDSRAIVNIIEPLANNGNTEAQNLLGVLYTKGFGVPKDENIAFALFKKAAKKGDANAQYNLGRLYKTGLPKQSIDFKKAIIWFKKAIANGHQRAAYSLGYMHYKGLGVPQNYKKAIKWFSKSNDPMAKHFLGLSYYQGYGVEANKEKALELLLENNIPNSRTLVSYIQNNQKKENDIIVETKIKNKVAKAYTSNNVTTELLLEEMTIIEPENEFIELTDLLGEWEGKWVEYDWSGAKVERILPLQITLTNESGQLKMTYTFMEEIKIVDAFWQDGYLYFNEPLTITLPRLYSSNPKELSLDYELLSIGLKKITLDINTPVILGKVDTYITNWSENGPPTKLALLPKGTPQTNSDEESLLQALEGQEEHFIKLYPVPFNNNLTIAYELKDQAEVKVELLEMYGTNIITISPKALKNAGAHTHSINIDSSLPKGLYIVHLTAGNQLYKRLIIKD